MSVPLYMDVHVPYAISAQLRLRQVDVLTAQDDSHGEASDDILLLRAAQLSRLLFTQDALFRVMAERWQREKRSFSGLAFGSQLGGTIGQYVEDLELIAKASDIDDWSNVVEYLPFARLSR